MAHHTAVEHTSSNIMYQSLDYTLLTTMNLTACLFHRRGIGRDTRNQNAETHEIKGSPDMPSNVR